MKSWLEKNILEMYSMHNEGKTMVVERFIRTLTNKIYEYMINQMTYLINAIHITEQLK